MIRILLCMLVMTLVATPLLAADLESRLNSLEETLKKQQKTIDEQQRLIEQLREELSTVRQQAPVKAEENVAQAVKPDQAAMAEQTPKASGLFGGSFMTNPYLSFVLNTFYYSSSVSGNDLKNRGVVGFNDQGFDQTKGFNIREGELFLFAPVDAYFNLYANIPFTDNGVSLEEAYFVTSSLPQGLQVKGGKFKSGFSRLNTQHPHAWDFADTPLAYRAFTGKEGIIEKGAQLTYLPALPFYTLLGVEALQGENETIFNQNVTGGPHAFTGYAKTSFDLSDSSTLLLGPYVIGGQTRTETVANGTFFMGNSTLYGFETVYKWKPSRDRSLILQGEYLWRDQAGSLDNLASASVSRLSRSQDGMYLQSLYQMGRWRLGARYDRLDIFTHDYVIAGVQEDFHKPWRLTGALEFNPSEFSRIRLQYNYDRSGGDGLAYGGGPRTNQEIYLQMILGIGAHAAHAF